MPNTLFFYLLRVNGNAKKCVVFVVKRYAVRKAKNKTVRSKQAENEAVSSTQGEVGFTLVYGPLGKVHRKCMLMLKMCILRKQECVSKHTKAPLFLHKRRFRSVNQCVKKSNGSQPCAHELNNLILFS